MQRMDALASDMRTELDRLAKSSLWGLRFRSPDDEDALQEARLGIYETLASVDPTRHPSEQRAYLRTSARGRVLNFLRWRARQEIPMGSFDDEPEISVSRPRPDPVDVLGIVAVLVDGYERLSAREKALMRTRITTAPLPDDLAKLHSSTRSVMLGRARRKLHALAVERGLEELLTPDLLHRVFGG